jgi:hypothetical protein
MEQWRLAMSTEASPNPVGKPVVAIASGSTPGAVGAWMVDGTATLLAWNGSGGIAADVFNIESRINAATRLGEVASCYHSPSSDDLAQVVRVLRDANAWYDQRRAWLATGGSDDLLIVPDRPHDVHRNARPEARPDVRRSLARVADATSANAGFSRRSESAAVAARLRQAAAAPLPLAVEWSLESLSESPDDAAVNTILDIIDRARPTASHVREQGIRCVALIVLMPEHA